MSDLGMILFPKSPKIIYPNVDQVNFGCWKGLIDNLAQPHHLTEDSIEVGRN